MTTKVLVDLRSDTVTVPTDLMREAMSTAAVGDDVYGEDPTINRLEELAASIIGKEAALYVPSGTMGNQVAVMTHTSRGDEVILDADAHIFYYEAGGMAVLSGVQPRTIPSQHGIMDPAAVKAAIRPDNVHFPRTTLLCLENTHNRAGGRAIPLEVMDCLGDLAHEAGLRVHLDGARVFNAALALGVEPSRLVRCADSVMFCLSKGLGAPVGSMVAGTADFIEEARRARKILGGSMRQAGILAAAGIVAFDTMKEQLTEDHRLARILAEHMAETPGVEIDPDLVDTNIVTISVKRSGRTGDEISGLLRSRGVLANAADPYRVRLVTHKDVGESQVRLAATIIHEIMSEVSGSSGPV